MTDAGGDSAEVAQAHLEAAIAADPAAVESFVERLDTVNEVLDAAELATAAMDDEMATGLADTGSVLAESADGLATRETAALAATVGEDAADIESALETLLRLERSGTLADLADLADVASLASAAVDDEMVTTLAGTGRTLGEVAETASDPATARGAETLLDGIGRAANTPTRVGPLGLLWALRDRDVTRGLGFVLEVLRGVGSAAGRS